MKIIKLFILLILLLFILSCEDKKFKIYFYFPNNRVVEVNNVQIIKYDIIDNKIEYYVNGKKFKSEGIPFLVTNVEGK